jgi:hypothetical protein
MTGFVAQNTAHDPTPWSGHVIWGNHRISGGELRVNASAWRKDVIWGSAHTPDGGNVAWGKVCAEGGCDNVVWGTACADTSASTAPASRASTAGQPGPSTGLGAGPSTALRPGPTTAPATGPSTGPGASCENVVWDTGSDGDNIVWGAACGGADCDATVWATARNKADADNVVRGASDSSEDFPTGLGAGPSTWLGAWLGAGPATSPKAVNIVWGTNVVDLTDPSTPLRSRSLVWSATAIRHRSRLLVADRAER